jgi:hypothetical protein
MIKAPVDFVSNGDSVFASMMLPLLHSHRGEG